VTRKKIYFGVGACALLIAAAMVAGWAAWRDVRALIAMPRSAATAPSQIIAATPGPSSSQEDWNFVGSWSGLWDNRLRARFTITHLAGRQLQVIYEWQNTPDGRFFRRVLRPTPTADVLFMRFGGLTLTLPSMGSNTLRGIGNFMVDGVRYRRTGVFVRDDAPPKINWLGTAGAAGPIILDIKATVDGSDVLNLSPHGAQWAHNTYDPATDVAINGAEWNSTLIPNLQAPGLAQADFSTARVVSRSGRDLVAMEQTAGGIAIYFDDALPGAAPYEIRIAMDRAGAKPHLPLTASDPFYVNVDANIDGSDSLTISASGSVWNHRSMDLPSDVRINQMPWDVAAHPNRSDLGLHGVNFSSAIVVQRSGRDTVALERTDSSLTIYFDDAPDGPGRYHIEIALNRTGDAGFR